MARSMFCLLFMSLLVASSAVDYKNYPKQEPKQEKEETIISEPESSQDIQKEDPSYYMNNAPKPKQNDYNNNSYKNESIGVQGFILCKSSQKSFPLVGGVVKISCVSEYENGYEGAPFYVESHKSDEKGFFFAKFTLSESMIGSDDHYSKLKECKVFLEDSPCTESCNVPTDVNNGISGAILSSPRYVPDKDMLLYSVGPFFYSSEDHPNEDHY